MENKKILFDLNHINKYFPGKNKLPTKAIDDISLRIYQGETLGLVGESGCGKSTLSRVLLRLDPQTDGSVIYYQNSNTDFCPDYIKKASGHPSPKDRKTFDLFQNGGIDLSRLTRKEMRWIRKDMQMVFQDPYSSLNPRMRIGETIGDSLVAHRFYPPKSRELQEYIYGILEECGLDSDIYYRYPYQLSGGQRQRVGIARALCLKPCFLICDEAVSALDVSIRSQTINLLQDLKKQRDLTYLFISHDLSVVKYISDRIAVMYLGTIVELAETEAIFTMACHPYTRMLLWALQPAKEDGRIEPLWEETDISISSHHSDGCKFHPRCPYKTTACELTAPVLTEISPGHFVSCHNRDSLKC